MQTIPILILVTAGLFVLKVLKDSSYALWLFQIKEYRWDRMRSHLRESVRLYPSDVFTALGIFVLLGIFFPATAKFILVFLLLLLGNLAPLYFLSSSLAALGEARRHAFKHPRPTTKILLVTLVYVLSFGSFVWLVSSRIAQGINIIYSVDFFVLFSFYLLVLSALAPLFILLAIFLVTPLADFQKKRIVARANRKMEECKHLKTIGITGSYGKTSTKEFLFAILSTKYRVVKTSGNNNTLMGVASTILGSVSDEFDYFICEMGAYRLGEIAEISALARPWAGIITGVNEQHLDLFGSLKNTKRTKFELVQGLPADGFAVINEQAAELPPRIDAGTEDAVFFSDRLIEGLTVSPEHIEFRYKDTVFRAHLLGKHYVLNLLSAIMAAEKLGMTHAEIQAAVEKIGLESEYLMRKCAGPRGAVFIDDSYSANPSGVMAALEYLEDAYPKSKKIFVFPGIIELGKSSKKIHQKLWAKANELCSVVYVMQSEDRELKKKYQKCRLVFEKDFDKISIDIQKYLDQNTVVLFESRGAGVVMRKTLNKTK